MMTNESIPDDFETVYVETVVLLLNQNAKTKHHVKVGIDAEEYYRMKESR